MKASYFDPNATPGVGGDQSGNAAGADIIREIIGTLIVPKQNETPGYDDGGRLVSNSIYTYTWDAESRLASVESTIKLDGTNRYKTEYAYDHAGRRVRKQVYTNNDSGWVLSRTHKFFYDTVTLGGSNSDFGLLAEEEITDHAASSTNTYQYLWGVDLNGSYHDLGGVGGLVAVIDKTADKIYIPLMDAKGSVYKYIDADNGIAVAEFDYDPYGRIMQRSGSQVANLSLRYQTKYHDTETNTYYYGVRHYDPTTCRWLSRDPLEEEGGYNLYAFVNNDPINNVDYLGMDYIDVTSSGDVYWIVENDGYLYNKDVRRIHLGVAPLQSSWFGLSTSFTGNVMLNSSMGGGNVSLEHLRDIANKFWGRGGTDDIFNPTDISGLQAWEQDSVVGDYIDHYLNPKGETRLLPYYGPLKSKVEKRLDALQTTGDIAGMTPGYGILADIPNTFLYLFRGKWSDFAWSAGACLPAIGQGATIAKYGKRGVDVLDKGADIAKVMDNVPDALRIGDKTTDVYIGMLKGQDIYVGISKNVIKRTLQHGSRFDFLQTITKQKLTRRQARAIEQALLLRNPQYANKINSIAKSRPWYNDAVEWGEAWLRANGY